MTPAGIRRSIDELVLVLAIITTRRWDAGDQLLNGHQLGTEWLSQLRAALDRDGTYPSWSRRRVR